ncbi:diphthine methyltransferase [Drosophila guanche]|uniref:methylated diphthine methylhydrolase n=1 Tax=Drosophila guanche TaxID=7266 RepID=A0A3B0K2P2_DROGU|nr:diphthine methyltransferase [Drosophila guanche]SPP77668.1 blast:Diphthamide biosynthesis protein 7 [Drosophila guanche]
MFAMFKTLHSVDTEYSADSVEWCAQDDQHAEYFACGTYQLVQLEEGEGEDDETTKKRPRKGRVYLYHFETGSGELERLQCIETAAILDMKWLPAWSSDSGPLLATANALGEVEIYELLADEKQLQKRTCLALAEAPLALALDWQRDGDAVQLVVSDSKGNISHLRYTEQGELSVVDTWNAHEFEAWTCAFDRWTPQLVYSGGDDCLLLARDLRTEQRVWTNRAHQAGVTCLLSHPQHEHHLLTGSYDEQLRLFDTRAMKRTLAEVNLGGGIWRLKPHPKRLDVILAACMYTNFSVVQLDLKDSALTLLGTYEEHSSICYGADWHPNLSEDDGLTHMATCSFYDHKMCVSSVHLGCVKSD